MTRAAKFVRDLQTWVLAGCAVGFAGIAAVAAPLTSEPAALSAEPIRPVPPVLAQDPARVALGEALFREPLLSRDGNRACVSCHDLGSNGATGRRTDESPDMAQLAVNTNTVFNAALSFRLDWSGDAATLEDEAEGSLLNHGLMATTMPEAIARLRANPALAGRFQQAYGHDPDRSSLLDALATFERTLVTPDSRFDLWLRGDSAAISSEELEGYQLFKSAGCISCHQGINVGGNLFEKNGIFAPVTASEPERMRVPSLRNVATTAPYFHDGSTPTLNDAVGKMAVAQLGRSLSPRQIELIVAFLGTLTGKYQGRAVTSAP